MNDFFRIWFDEVTGRFLLETDQQYYLIVVNKPTRRSVMIYNQFSQAARYVLKEGWRSTHSIMFVNNQ